MNYPRHIAIIPDGNRTRAKERDLPSILWHKAWYERAKEIAMYSLWETSIEIVTLRWASTENIQERSQEELSYLYEIYQTITTDMEEFYDNNGIGVKWIGSEKWLPESLINFFRDQEKRFISKNGKYIILAVNYWGRDEIIRGIKEYIKYEWIDNINQLNEEILSNYMDLWNIAPVDLVIRSKWELAKRLSGFMSRWIGYAELYFFEKYFPDFTIEELKKSLQRFDSIIEHRNFGK
jgi:undecaprenyl diphosphate synthase